MKTRYKIFLVIGSFVAFYFALIPLLQLCVDSANDCTVWKELVVLTRPVVTSSPHVWDTGEEIGEWIGSTEQMENPSLEEQVMYNLPFVVSMLVLPFVIIGFVVTLEKRK